MFRPDPIRILYIEQDVQLAQLVRGRLEQAGYSVDLAHDGQAGLDMCAAAPYDVVTVNQAMPGRDGLDVIRRLTVGRRSPATIVVAECGDEKFIVEAMKLGASDYVIKNGSGGYLDLLPSVIEHTLIRRQLEQDRQRVIEALQESQEALHQRSRALAQLNRLGQELTATLDLRQIAALLSRATTEIIGTESVSVWLLDQPEELVCWTSSDQLHYGQECSPVDLRMRADQGIAGWVVRRGESVMVNDAAGDPRFFPDIEKQIDFRTHSLLAVPLRVRGATIGVMEVLNKLTGKFTADDLALAETLAASVAIAIDNARMVEELRQYTAELETQNAELDAFAHTVAHDLKNPLTGLVGAGEVLQDWHTRLPPEKMREFVRMIVQNGHKMTNIIEELLLLASVRQMDEVATSRLDMGQIVAEAAGRLTNMIAEYQAEISLPDAWPAAIGYGPWVEEVWANYISNALKYGGAPPRVELGFSIADCGSRIADHEWPPLEGKSEIRNSKSEICFWVRDNGPGLKREEQAQLFTQFTRLHQARAEGYGLGLSIVRRIVEKLGGQVGVESGNVVGQGSTFWFTLPAADS